MGTPYLFRIEWEMSHVEIGNESDDFRKRGGESFYNGAYMGNRLVSPFDLYEALIWMDNRKSHFATSRR